MSQCTEALEWTDEEREREHAAWLATLPAPVPYAHQLADALSLYQSGGRKPAHRFIREPDESDEDAEWRKAWERNFYSDSARWERARDFLLVDAYRKSGGKFADDRTTDDPCWQVAQWKVRAMQSEETTEFGMTDVENGHRLVVRHGDHLRYVPAWKTWLVWDGTRWRKDDRGEIYELAKETARSIYAEASAAQDFDHRKALSKWAGLSESAARIEAMVKLARTESGIPVTPEELDSDPWLLNVENGTLDLRTGKLRECRRDDLMTKLAPVRYDPAASAPVFDRYLRRTFAGDEDLIGFVQRAAGYTLTGNTAERVVFILYGSGQNGKSVFVKTLRSVLGDYGMRTETDTLMKRQGANYGAAGLKGARLVSASESEDGQQFATAFVKDATGDEPIAARQIYEKAFEYVPEFKLWLATNHRPRVSAEDQAIWDRLRLIPFEVRIPDAERDLQLSDKLKAEAAGILAWAVRGCLEWQRSGLGVSSAVREATDAYRSEMDTLGDFIEERCIVRPDVKIEASALHRVYSSWSIDAGGRPLGLKKFNSRMEAREGITKVKASVTVLHGIALAGEREEREHIPGLPLGNISIETPGSISHSSRSPAPPAPPAEMQRKKGDNQWH